MAKEEENLDWYGILNVTIDVTTEQIEKAARKLARKYHPDRNKSAEAPQLFLNVQKAKEFLMDDSKRKGYDENIRRQSKRKEYDVQRSRNMDSKRKKMKEDLEERLGKAHTVSRGEASERKEAAAASKKARHDMEEEIRKLRRDGMSRMHAAGQSERDITDEELLYHRTSMTASGEDSTLVQVKVKWKRSQQSHSDDSLCQLFRTFGHIEDVTLLQGKGNTAIITFSTNAAANAAVKCYEGSSTLQVSLIGSQKKAAVFTHVYDSANSSRKHSVFIAKGHGHGKHEEGSVFGQSGAPSDLLTEMRRAVERDELLRQTMRAEGYEGQQSQRTETANDQNGSASFAAFGLRGVQQNSSLEAIPSLATKSEKVDLASKENDILAKMLAMHSTKAK